MARTDTLTPVPDIHSLVGTRDVAGVKSTGRIPIGDLAAQLLTTSPISTVIGQALTSHAAGISLVVDEEEITLAGASTDTTMVIPIRAMVLAVSMRVNQLITGATSFSMGIAGSTTKFGTTLGVSVGWQQIGLITPEAFYSPTPIRLTAAGGNFTGGKVRVAIHRFLFSAPGS